MTEELATLTDRSTVVFVRSLPGPIERVWRYLTDSQLLATWFSDGTVGTRPGEPATFSMGAYGKIVTYEPPHLLEYSWNEDDSSCGPVRDSIVRWELAEEGNRVRLTLTHARLHETTQRPHGAGWHAFLDRLEAIVSGREPESLDRLYAHYKAVYDDVPSVH